MRTLMAAAWMVDHASSSDLTFMLGRDTHCSRSRCGVNGENRGVCRPYAATMASVHTYKWLLGGESNGVSAIPLLQPGLRWRSSGVKEGVGVGPRL
jgi:hypothetical protein